MHDRSNSFPVAIVIATVILLSACASTPPDEAAGASSIVEQARARSASKLPPTYSGLQQQQPQSKAATSEPSTATPDPLIVWWDALRDPVLSSFVQDALAHNEDLAIAIAKVAQAKASADRLYADQKPSLDIGGSVTRARRSIEDPALRAFANSPSFQRDSTTLRADNNLNWEIDLFGRRSSLANASALRAKAAEADQHAVRLTVVAEVARQTILARTLQHRIRLAHKATTIETKIVEITRARLKGGQISEIDLLRAQGIEQDIFATAEKLGSDLSEVIHALALLLSVSPENVKLQINERPNYSFDALEVAIPLAVVPRNVPADLLRLRPDIVRAELQLSSASLDLSATVAERFPKVNLGAILALVASGVSGLGSANALLASIAPSVTWRALDGGRLEADIARAKGAELEALVRYRQSVNTAFAEADTAVSEIARRAVTAARTRASVEVQLQVLEIVNIQHERGLVDLLTALEIKRGLIRSQEAHSASQQAQLLAFVTMYRVLAGGR